MRMWLDTRRAHIDVNTYHQYKGALNFWYALRDQERELFGGRPLGEIPVQHIGEAELQALIGRHPWASQKVMNNYLTPLRGVFKVACKALKIAHNPIADVKNAKLQKGKPDPFTAEEREQILAYMRRTFDDRVWAYFNWQFFTGMRPEETTALKRDCINWQDGTVRVEAVRTGGKDKEHTKTHSARDVDLNDRALESLNVMRNYWKDDDHGLVFERPEYAPSIAIAACHPARPHRARGLCRVCYQLEWQRARDEGRTLPKLARSGGRGKPHAAGPWDDERSQRDTYWKPTLEALGLRYRKPYRTRHTFATVCLMGGANPATWPTSSAMIRRSSSRPERGGSATNKTVRSSRA